jgi:hypothetical protein
MILNKKTSLYLNNILKKKENFSKKFESKKNEPTHEI